jgi:hypothetical protein
MGCDRCCFAEFAPVVVGLSVCRHHGGGECNGLFPCRLLWDIEHAAGHWLGIISE